MGLMEKLQSKLELYRLEQRYTRRRHRSMLFNEVQYVDGEYVYSSNTSPTSPTGTMSKSSTGSHWRPSWGRSTTSESR